MELDGERGQYHFNARSYDQKLSRFFAPDLLFEMYPNQSPYSYSANNPVNFKDPSGLKFENENSNESYFIDVTPSKQVQEGRNHSTTLRLGEEPETRVLLGGAGGATYGNHGTGIYEFDFFMQYSIGNIKHTFEFGFNAVFSNDNLDFVYNTSMEFSDYLGKASLGAFVIAAIFPELAIAYETMAVLSYFAISMDILALSSKSIDIMMYDGQFSDLSYPLFSLSTNFYVNYSISKFGNESINSFPLINPKTIESTNTVVSILIK